MKDTRKCVLALAVLVGLASWMEIVSTRDVALRPGGQERSAAVRRSSDAHPPAELRESASSSVMTPAAREQFTATYYRLPLSFEANEGQTDPRVKFFSRGPGYSLFLAPSQATLVFHRRFHEDSAATLRSVEFTRLALRPVETSSLRLELVGTNPNAAMTGLEEQPGRSNYFRGNDPRKWVSNVAQYGKVRMAQVYPGIDLVFYGNRQQLEYDFNVAAGADPKAIRLRVAGARRVRLAANGDVQIESQAGEIRLHRPFLYQNVSGERRPVEGRFLISSNGEISFATGSYDRTLPLIIDPVLAFSEIIDSGGGGEILGVAVDGNRNVYVTGNTCGPDYPTTPGPFTTQHFPFALLCEDVVVTKFDPTASTLIYSDLIGGSGTDSGTRLAVDGQGNVYLTGTTNSNDFPTTPNAILPSSSLSHTCGSSSHTKPCFDAFALKLSADGSTLLYSTLLGGSQNSHGLDIKANSNGEAHVLGLTAASDFVPRPNGLQTTFGGGTCTIIGSTATRPCHDVFLVKLSADGGSAPYSTFLGGNDEDDAFGLALDGSGNVYIAGGTNSTNFPKTTTIPPTGGAPNQMAAYAAKINPGANPPSSGLIYSILLQGDQLQGAGGIAIDGNGNAYLTGATNSPHFRTTVGAFQPNYAAGSNTNCQVQRSKPGMPAPCGNAFVAGINSTGTALLFSTFLGGVGPDGGIGIAFDAPSNSLWVTGSTASTNFPTTSDAYHTLAQAPMQNGAFLSNLSANGSSLLFSTLLSAGGASTESAAIAVDGASNVYVVGIDSDVPPGFPVTSGVYPFDTITGPASFLVKFSPGSAPLIQFSPKSITFPDVALGSASAPQTITVQNTGAGPMQIGIQMGTTVDGNMTPLSTPNFIESDNCGTTLAPGGQCAVQVTFDPTPNPPPPFPNQQPSNKRAATLTILDNAPGAPHTVALASATGNGPAFVVEQNPVVFPAAQKPGTTSPVLDVLGSNNGDANLTVSSVTLGGANASDFTLILTGPSIPHPCSSSVATTVFCTFELTFHPPTGATGTRTATVTFTDNAADSPQVINVTATVDTAFNATPTTLNIGPTAINAPTPTIGLVTLDNPTASGMQISSLTLSGTNVADFSVNSGGCSPNPPPFTVAAGTTCNIQVPFRPTSGSGGPRIASLAIGSPTPLSVAVNGAAVSNTDPSFSLFVVPKPMNFGGIPLGEKTPVGNALFTISNPPPFPCGGGATSCGGPLNITSMAAGNPDFTLAPSVGQPSFCTPPPASIPSNNGCTYSVTFAPSVGGDRSTMITIQSNNPQGQVTIPLGGSGIALPVALVSPTVLAFGKSAIGVAGVPQTVTLTNTGRANLIVTSITPPANYAVANNGCTQPVPPNGSCPFTVTFTPPGAGNFLGTLIIADNGAFGGQQAVGISGSGGSGPALMISPSFINFGNQVQNTFSAPQTITLTSSGDTAVNIAANGFRTTGDFPILSTTCGSSLATKSTCTALVQFHPSTPFFETGSLLAASSAPGSPQVAYFQGFGISAGTASTTTTLASSLNPAPAGQMVTFTATVMSTTAGTLTGTVTFLDGATQLGTSAVSSGQARLAISSLATGTHTITAAYSGDANFHGSTSSALQQVITGSGQSPTTTTVASSANPSTFGQSVTFTATVTSTGGTPAGVVNFLDGANILGMGTLDGSGKATFMTSSLSAGSHSITAAYLGNANFAPSTSVVLTQTVNKAGTATAVASSLNPSTVGQGVTFTATATSAAGTPTGTVTFLDGTTTLGMGTLNGSAQAMFMTSSLTTGSHSITASYSGDANFASSTSSALNQVVNAASAPAVTLSATSFAFGNVNVGDSKAASPTITLTNSGNAALTITAITVGGANPGDFSQANTCPVSPQTLAANANCTITPTFRPTATGAKSASVSISDNASGSPQGIALTGTGVDFAISGPPSAVTVNAGQPANFTINLTGGPTVNTTTFSASGNPAATTVTFNPPMIPTGSTMASTTMTITTTAPSAVPPRAPFSRPPMPKPIVVMSLAVLLALAGLWLLRRSTATRRFAAYIPLALLALALAFATGCGSANNQGGGGTPRGTFTIMVTATSGAVSHTTPVTLTVN